MHLKYKVYPDLSIFGKALGNGYPITAIIGKSKYMNSVKDTFISSTFWTERLGSVAALKTLEIMERKQSWKIISKKGLELKSEIKKLARKNEIKIEFSGISSLFNFNVVSKYNRNYNQIITSEMIKFKILATNSIYCSISHDNSHIKKYLFCLNNVFSLINKLEKNIQLPEKYLFNKEIFKFDRLN